MPLQDSFYFCSYLSELIIIRNITAIMKRLQSKMTERINTQDLPLKRGEGMMMTASTMYGANNRRGEVNR